MYVVWLLECWVIVTLSRCPNCWWHEEQRAPAHHRVLFAHLVADTSSTLAGCTPSTGIPPRSQAHQRGQLFQTTLTSLTLS